MSKSVQEFLAVNTEQAAKDLIKAATDVPVEKQAWKPEDKGRSVIDMVAECAILGDYTATVLQQRNWPADAFQGYGEDKAAIEGDLETATAKLNEVIPVIMAAIRDLKDEELGVELTTPFGPMTLEKIATYPYWNMSYHQGQSTYIEVLAK